MRLHVAACAALASPALAAYVQWQYCDGYNGNPKLVPDGLSAYVERHESRTRLAFHLLERTTRDDCDSIASDLNTTVDIKLLGRSGRYSEPADTACSVSRWAPDGDNRSTILDVALSTEVDILYPVSTFHLDLRLAGQTLTDEIECISANITPEFTQTVKMTLRLLPVATFLLVLILGWLRSSLDVPEVITEEQDDTTQLTGQSVLPGVGDCLFHLQFVFLTGALSLRYPGFYQPAVSHLNWFSLLTNSNVLTGGITYPGVRDGIYQINGTYGGTYGLEIMTQIVGAPMTMDLWVNMVILITLISIGIAFLLEVIWYLNRHRRFHSQEEPREHTGFRRLASQVLRSVLSYFLLPLVTLSAYQLGQASLFPAYHTSLAVGFIVVIILAFLWLLHQLPVRSLGALILDHSKVYRPIPSTGRSDNSFILSFFALTFIRAIAIGGLQLSAATQITILIVSEIAFIVCIAAFNPDSIVSTSSACAINRLITIILMITFLPGLASLSTKSIIGYILLFQQVMVLLLAILLPSVYQLIQLCLRARAAEDAPVYSLRQLRRRRTRNDMDHEQYPDTASHDSDTESVSNIAHMPHPVHIDHPRGFRSDTSSVSSCYYRPPRSSSRSTPTLSLALQPVTDTQSSPSSSSIDAESETRNSLDSPEPDSTVESLSSRSTTPRLSGSTFSTAVPLGPRWDDYSFREVDLAYGRPPGRSSDKGESQPERQPHKRYVSNRSIFSLALERQSPKPKGFQVDRP